MLNGVRCIILSQCVNEIDRHFNRVTSAIIETFPDDYHCNVDDTCNDTPLTQTMLIFGFECEMKYTSNLFIFIEFPENGLFVVVVFRTKILKGIHYLGKSSTVWSRRTVTTSASSSCSSTRWSNATGSGSAWNRPTSQRWAPTRRGWSSPDSPDPLGEWSDLMSDLFYFKI